LVVIGSIDKDEVTRKTSPADVGDITAAAIDNVARSALADAAGK
jgi:hypothetical protein